MPRQRILRNNCKLRRSCRNARIVTCYWMNSPRSATGPRPLSTHRLRAGPQRGRIEPGRRASGRAGRRASCATSGACPQVCGTIRHLLLSPQFLNRGHARLHRAVRVWNARYGSHSAGEGECSGGKRMAPDARSNRGAHGDVAHGRPAGTRVRTDRDPTRNERDRRPLQSDSTGRSHRLGNHASYRLRTRAPGAHSFARPNLRSGAPMDWELAQRSSPLHRTSSN